MVDGEMRLTRTPVPWCYGSPEGSDLRVCSAILSDGTLLLLVSIGRDWRRSHPDDWEAELAQRFADMFAHVKEHRVGFGLVLHLRPDVDVSVDIVRTVSAIVKRDPEVLRRHLKGTVVIVPSTSVEVIVWTAVAFSRPLRPFETYVMTAKDMAERQLTEWGLPRDLEKKTCKKIVSLPWPDGST